MLTAGDLPELFGYRSDYREPADFDAFWKGTLADSRADRGAGLDLTPVHTGLETVEVFDAAFPGFAGHPVRGWLRLPRHRSGPLPAVVQFHGYGSGRGAPVDDLLWASAGYAHLVMDTRGQGGAWAGGGATPDPVGSGPSHPGFLTRGIQDKETYVYRRVFTDAVRAVDALRACEHVDGERIAAIGNSQGGGIALAVAGLVPDLAAAHIQSPFLTDVRRATRLTGEAPWDELIGYLAARRELVEQTFTTLGYFDGLAFAARATAPAWFSAGLRDTVCPPQTAVAAHHAYAGPKQLRLWEFNGHDAGGSEDLAIALSAFGALLKTSSHPHPHNDPSRKQAS
ncbi:acetylxylan esterase [Streptacidiphilus carbonis]|uniref:acetylxylan esterase n=1 Tax=Streptacidiphilus carbonis TaxID=105422 RepID=UPI0005AA667D|nr:alpha/beta fold hydrolase [Streptacidiphilus carbonis]